MIRIRDITLPFDHKAEALTRSILKRLGITAGQLLAVSLVRRSIDARRKSRIVAVYTVDVAAENETRLLAALADDPTITPAPSTEYMPPVATCRTGPRPVVVGSGPCGLFAALILAQAGCRPLLIERGRPVETRLRDVREFWSTGRLDGESNVQFGEGGAGTFSDGKLTTRIKDKHNRCRKVLNEFVRAGAPEEILYHARAHIGTDNLVAVVRNIRKAILSLDGDVRFETKLTSVNIKDGSVTAAVVNHNETIETDTIILALGHSARDTVSALHDLGVPMQAKPFSIGVRIEHPQDLIDKSQYGRFASHPLLEPAEYKLVTHCPNGRSAYTFCMCPGGQVIASASEPGAVVTNGMSRYKRSLPNANSALLVGITPDDFGGDGPLAGIEFQRRWEHKAFEVAGGSYFAPVQLVGDFLTARASESMGSIEPTYTPGVTPCDLADCLPPFVTETLRLALPRMDANLRGFAAHDTVMTALESRSSSPVRILRDETLQSIAVKGLYPAGEGAGYAGGIVSAAVDGIKVAEAIIAATPPNPLIPAP